MEKRVSIFITIQKAVRALLSKEAIYCTALLALCAYSAPLWCPPMGKVETEKRFEDIFKAKTEAEKNKAREQVREMLFREQRAAENMRQFQEWVGRQQQQQENMRRLMVDAIAERFNTQKMGTMHPEEQMRYAAGIEEYLRPDLSGDRVPRILGERERATLQSLRERIQEAMRENVNKGAQTQSDRQRQDLGKAWQSLGDLQVKIDTHLFVTASEVERSKIMEDLATRLARPRAGEEVASTLKMFAEFDALKNKSSEETQRANLSLRVDLGRAAQKILDDVLNAKPSDFADGEKLTDQQIRIFKELPNLSQDAFKEYAGKLVNKLAKQVREARNPGEITPHAKLIAQLFPDVSKKFTPQEQALTLAKIDIGRSAIDALLLRRETLAESEKRVDLADAEKKGDKAKLLALEYTLFNNITGSDRGVINRFFDLFAEAKKGGNEKIVVPALTEALNKLAYRLSRLDPPQRFELFQQLSSIKTETIKDKVNLFETRTKLLESFTPEELAKLTLQDRLVLFKAWDTVSTAKEKKPVDAKIEILKSFSYDDLKRMKPAERKNVLDAIFSSYAIFEQRAQVENEIMNNLLSSAAKEITAAKSPAERKAALNILMDLFSSVNRVHDRLFPALRDVRITEQSNKEALIKFMATRLLPDLMKYANESMSLAGNAEGQIQFLANITDVTNEYADIKLTEYSKENIEIGPQEFAELRDNYLKLFIAQKDRLLATGVLEAAAKTKVMEVLSFIQKKIAEQTKTMESAKNNNALVAARSIQKELLDLQADLLLNMSGTVTYDAGGKRTGFTFDSRYIDTLTPEQRTAFYKLVTPEVLVRMKPGEQTALFNTFNPAQQTEFYQRITPEVVARMTLVEQKSLSDLLLKTLPTIPKNKVSLLRADSRLLLAATEMLKSATAKLNELRGPGEEVRFTASPEEIATEDQINSHVTLLTLVLNEKNKLLNVKDGRDEAYKLAGKSLESELKSALESLDNAKKAIKTSGKDNVALKAITDATNTIILFLPTLNTLLYRGNNPAEIVSTQKTIVATFTPETLALLDAKNMQELIKIITEGPFEQASTQQRIPEKERITLIRDLAQKLEKTALNAEQSKIMPELVEKIATKLDTAKTPQEKEALVALWGTIAVTALNEINYNNIFSKAIDLARNFQDKDVIMKLVARIDKIFDSGDPKDRLIAQAIADNKFLGRWRLLWDLSPEVLAKMDAREAQVYSETIQGLKNQNAWDTYANDRQIKNYEAALKIKENSVFKKHLEILKGGEKGQGDNTPRIMEEVTMFSQDFNINDLPRLEDQILTAKTPQEKATPMALWGDVAVAALSQPNSIRLFSKAAEFQDRPVIVKLLTRVNEIFASKSKENQAITERLIQDRGPWLLINAMRPEILAQMSQAEARIYFQTIETLHSKSSSPRQFAEQQIKKYTDALRINKNAALEEQRPMVQAWISKKGAPMAQDKSITF